MSELLSAPSNGAAEPVDTTYRMTVTLSVLESLGINLYSNAAAVLSELVANAYDADASKVDIKWEAERSDARPSRVVVSDDGCGMTASQINERFLTAGYKKRETEGTTSAKNRPYMGRKGIGKLSVFSLANVVDVFTWAGADEPLGLQIDVSELQAAIKSGRDYYPQPVPVPAEYRSRGTTLVLSSLRSKRASLTAAALRKRLARRFDVMDTRSAEEGGFSIVVNERAITYADRQELKKLEFLWEFGTSSLPDSALPKNITRFVVPGEVDAARGWTITGWFGTARRPTDLTDDDDAGSLKNIIVLARKRPIQEGIIEKLDFSRIFGNYVTGQVEADFLDLDGEEYDDIATSDRQRLIEDDDRVLALQSFLRSAFVKAADTWSAQRPKKEAVDALARYPKLKEWLGGLPPYQTAAAETMIGTVASLTFERGAEPDRATLFRAGILAFERVGLRQSAQDLQSLSSVTPEDLLQLLGQTDAYEAGLWVDILRARIGAIEELQRFTDQDDLEVILQRHLMKHLWLLDPSWERATGSEAMEENLRKIEPGLFATDETGKEIHGRIDIRYATQSGRHVIIELKRHSVDVMADTLYEQGAKYHGALSSILRKQRRDDEIPKIEVVFVLGNRPRTGLIGNQTADQYITGRFGPIKGDYVLYGQLIERARKQYEAYLDASEAAKKLDALLSTLDEIGIESTDGVETDLEVDVEASLPVPAGSGPI